jgi:hypothetical protein
MPFVSRKCLAARPVGRRPETLGVLVSP